MPKQHEPHLTNTLTCETAPYLCETLEGIAFVALPQLNAAKPYKAATLFHKTCPCHYINQRYRTLHYHHMTHPCKITQYHAETLRDNTPLCCTHTISHLTPPKPNSTAQTTQYQTFAIPRDAMLFRYITIQCATPNYPAAPNRSKTTFNITITLQRIYQVGH